VNESTDPRHPQAAALAAQLRRAERAATAPWLHGEVARRMAGRLALIRTPPARVIDWWAAMGGSRGQLGLSYPQALVAAVEPTAVLVARSTAAMRPPWWRRLHRAPPQVAGDDAVAPGVADMLWANMVLHRVDDPDRTIARWHAAIADDGFLMFSTLGPDTLRELRTLYAALGWGAPAQAFVDMHDIGDALVQAGFADPVMDMERLTLTYSGAAELMEDLRGLGRSVHAGRPAGLRSRQWRQRLIEALDSALPRDADGRLQLTVEVVYGHAFKAPPRPHKGPATVTAVAMDEMRAMLRAGRR